MTVKLRRGIYWSDGVEFTTDDVIYTIQTHLNANRDRGASHDATPPTPPGIRVRTTAVRRIKRPPAYPWRTVRDL